MGVYTRDYDKSKRQERVAHLVRSEIADIVQLGFPIKAINTDNAPSIDEELRRRISIVTADVSPDLRQARITVSIFGDNTDIIDKRRAYSWLVYCTKSIRHALAQRLSHLKVLPNLTFVQADVGSAVDVMQLIDKVTKEGYKRESLVLGEYFSGDDDHEEGGTMMVPSGLQMGMDFDDDGEDDDGWMDEDDDFEDEDDYDEEDGEYDEEDDEGDTDL